MFSLHQFWILITLYLSALVVISNNTVHSFFYLGAVFVNAALILASWKSDFMALILIIVYVGAIAVLFSFLIMSVNQRRLKATPFSSELRPKFAALAFVFWISFIFALEMEKLFPEFLRVGADALNFADWETCNFDNHSFQRIVDLFCLLYTQYSFIFIITGFVLLVSIVCALSLALYSLKYQKKF